MPNRELVEQDIDVPSDYTEAMDCSDTIFMERALALAAKGRGAVEPNPMVGAVFVRDGRLLGEGYHQRFGGPHAEIEAIGAARRAGHDLVGATAYVTLEPCSHYGKTPPCADALIEAGVARVVAAMVDPDENVAGRGLQRMRDAGIVVDVGVGEKEALHLLAPYVTLRQNGRPWVIAKWAQTADGYLALPEGEGQWISSPASRQRVHDLRAHCDAIAVGVGTVLADDPLLTNRSGGCDVDRPLRRVVFDGSLRTPLDSQLVRTASDAPVLIFTGPDAKLEQPERVALLQAAGVEVGEIPAPGGRLQLTDALQEMGRRGWMHLLVEGGPTILSSLANEDLIDELWAFVSSRTVGTNGVGLPRWNIDEQTIPADWQRLPVERIEGDQLRRFRRQIAASR